MWAHAVDRAAGANLENGPRILRAFEQMMFAADVALQLFNVSTIHALTCFPTRLVTPTRHEIAPRPRDERG